MNPIDKLTSSPKVLPLSHIIPSLNDPEKEAFHVRKGENAWDRTMFYTLHKTKLIFQTSKCCHFGRV